MDLEEPLLPGRLMRELQKPRKATALFASVVLFAIFVLRIPASVPSNVTEDRLREGEKPLPTPLGVLDPKTGKSIHVFHNPLYKQLKQSTFQKSDDEFLSEALLLDTTELTRVRQSLTISWGHLETSELDVLALYCPSDAPHPDFLEAATLEQVRATSPGIDPDEWYIPHFPVFQHESCQFRLFHPVHSTDNDGRRVYRHVASSPLLKIPKTAPTNIHLALGNDPTTMVVQFSTGDAPNGDAGRLGTPVVQYGPVDGGSVVKNQGTSQTYTANDLCQDPANETGTGKFQSPGTLHVVSMTDLQPLQQYQYKVGLAGGQGIVWSETYTFRSPPPVGYKEEPFSYLVYGDQGCPSTGWGEGGMWTAAMIAEEVDTITSVHHFGDLSYARGAAHIWEDWFHMIEPYTSRVPLMVGVGNHEYDHTAGGDNGRDPSGVTEPHGFMPEWGNYGMDSGGECGVPTARRFNMPSSAANSNGVFWYSFDYATVHTIMLSSEHNLTKGSPQYTFLEGDLASVNRTVTPWVVVELHRPLYESELVLPERRTGVGLRMQIEDLLHEYGVDLVLSGHYHAYLRTCDGLYKSKCNNGGPTYLTVGSAGAILDLTLLYPQHWTEKFIRLHFGYGRITVANASALHFEFVRAGPERDQNRGAVADEVWITRDRGV